MSYFCTILEEEEGKKLYRAFLKWQHHSGLDGCLRSGIDLASQGIRERSAVNSSTCAKEMKPHLFAHWCSRMRIESVGKKPNQPTLQLCTYFKNDSLPLVGTFNSERVMLLFLLLLLSHPPPLPRRIHLASRDICRAARWFLWQLL